MARNGSLTFVGFGLGPIQAGLFLLEAQRSGAFSRLVVAEVLPDVVRAVRENDGFLAVNVAHADRVEVVRVGPIEILDPADERDRHELADAVTRAHEIATAVPSTRFYRTDAPGSIHRVLARGIATREEAPLAIYAAENHNFAAEILAESVLKEVPRERRAPAASSVSFLNTVIGKMSGTISDPDEVKDRGLQTLTPAHASAFLVEEFSRILVSRPHFAPGTAYARGLSGFEEKDELLPFEEAKLYGHNAVHALGGFLAARAGLRGMEELETVPGAVPFLRAAFLEESGAGLIGKHAGRDALFTEAGYRLYADDLIARMLNPYLGDRVERVARDPGRKLGWNDRFAGTMRLALEAGVRPRRLALGAAAALEKLLEEGGGDGEAPGRALEALWRGDHPDPLVSREVAALVTEGRYTLGRTRALEVFRAP